MNTMPDYISIQLRCRLPLVVHGGLTTWRLFEDRFGKNGSRLALTAQCLETGESVILVQGRERTVTHTIANNLTAKHGTIPDLPETRHREPG